MNRALELDPQFAAAAGLLADIQVSSGELDKGMMNYERASKLIDARNLTDRESLRIRGLFAADTSQFSKSEEVFTRYTREYPRDPLGYLYRATAVHSQGRMDEALHLYEQAVQFDSSRRSSFHNNYGACLLGAGRVADAEREAIEASKLRDGDWTDQLRCALAFSRFDAAGVEGRIAHLKKTASLPYQSKVFLLESCWRAELGKWDTAVTLLRNGLSFDLANSQPLETYVLKLRALAQLYVRQGRSADAAACCEEILDRRPGERFVMEAGALLARSGNPSRARQCVPDKLPKDPPSSPPQSLPAGARAELMEWPRYWRRVILLWAEIALAEGAPERAFKLISSAPPQDILEEWPETLVRAAIASREQPAARDWLQKLASNPGSFWLWTETTGPGFIREAYGWARGLGQPAESWTSIGKFIGLNS